MPPWLMPLKLLLLLMTMHPLMAVLQMRLMRRLRSRRELRCKLSWMPSLSLLMWCKGEMHI